jgi:hypothetical protein
MPEKNRRARTEDVHDKLVQMQRHHAAHGAALSNVLRFNAMMSTRGPVWFWPTVGAALVSQHHWLLIACDGCHTTVHSRPGPASEAARPRGLDPRRPARRVLPALRRPRETARGGAGAAAFDLRPAVGGRADTAQTRTKACPLIACS